MKKSKYLNKYDYISFYTKPPGLWFFNNNEIQSWLETQIKEYKIKKGLVSAKSFDYIDDDEEETDSSEFDSYEYYKEQLIENQNLDQDNPLIIQGNIIDHKSREYILETYNFVDKNFDLEKIHKTKDNDKLAELTKKYLTEYDSVILFQSVFIDKDLVTKPDAVIKHKGNLYVIETKGTTSAKFIHYLDLFFQMKVIENQKYLNNQDLIFNYGLCLIKYCYLNKNEISFEITWNINLKKNVSIPTEHKVYEGLKDIEIVNLKNAIKKGNASTNEYAISLNIKKLMYDNFDDLDGNIECSKGISRKAFNNSKHNVLLLNSKFDEAIESMKKFRSKMNDESMPEFLPSKNDKSPFKNCDFFPLERKLYSLMGYNLFDYSGLVADQTAESIENATKNAFINDFLKQPKKNPNVFTDLFSRYKQYHINKDACTKLLEELKSKKVYFDFETVNTPIRVVDNSLPFAQIVTQCSIIKCDDTKDKLENLDCDNMIIDPQKVNLKWFKDVIDNIYWGPSYKEYLNNKYDNSVYQSVSYVVYNKSFEKSRLKEMAKMINEKEYTFKVSIICDNLFDLADFFKLRSESPTHIAFFNELGGFYSIKKVLPLINKYYKEIYTITKCLDYETLDIKNGQICQTETVKRFFNIIDEKQWKVLEKQMQIYCENDVRAMIAVEYFIKYFWSLESDE